jgi:hypothetical protein
MEGQVEEMRSISGLTFVLASDWRIGGWVDM